MLSLRKSLFLFVVLIAVTFSLWSLFQQSIRLDEAQSLWISTKPMDLILKFTGEDVHVPLYGTILHFWVQIFGTSVLAARSLSVLFYLATLPFLYLAIKESSNSRIAFLTTGLFAISPFVIWYSNEARMYTLFTMVVSASHLFFLRVLRTDAKSNKLGYFLATLLGIYTHYFFLFVVLTQFLYLWIYSTSQKTRLKIIALQFLGGITFIPWGLYALHLGVGSNTQPLIPPPTSYNIFQTLVLFLFGFQGQFLQSLFVSLWPLAVIILFFIFTRRQKVPVENSGYFIMMTFLPIIFIFLISMFKPIFLARYLIFVVPTLFYLIMLVVIYYSGKLARTVLAILLIATAGLLFYQNTSASTSVKEDYRCVDQVLNSQVTSEDIVAVTAPFTVYPIEYYYKGRARIDTIPQWDRFNQGAIPPYSDQKLIDQINTYQKQYNNLYVAFSYDQGYEDKIKNYLETHLQKLSQKVCSPGLELREYKLRYP